MTTEQISNMPLPAALVATDTERDVQMTTPGTGSEQRLQGSVDIGQMFDLQARGFDQLKEAVQRREAELLDRISALEQQNEMKDHEIAALRSRLAVALRGTESQATVRPAHSLQDQTSSHPGSLVQPGGDNNPSVGSSQLEKKLSDLQVTPVTERVVHVQSAPVMSSGPRVYPGATHDPQPRGDGRGGGPAMPTRQDSEEKCDFLPEHRLYLVDEMPAKQVKQLLRHLSIPEQRIDGFYMANPTEPTECCVQGLYFWKNLKGSEATVGAMLTALIKCSLRDVAERFCQNFKFHQLLNQLRESSDRGQDSDGSAQSPPPTAQQVWSTDDDTDGPAPRPSPPAPCTCPHDAPPLQRLLWPHLRSTDSFSDLEQELEDKEIFTPEQLSKFSKGLFPKETAKRDPFIQACGDGKAHTVLLEWAKVEVMASPKQAEVTSGALRGLGKLLRKADRKDIRACLLCYIEYGVLGPSVDEKDNLRNDAVVCYTTKRDLGIELSTEQTSGIKDWRTFASDVGYKSQHIEAWAKERYPGVHVLKTWMTGKNSTVGNLYNWAVQAGRMDILKILESDMSARNSFLS